jgi:hypothetical protein
MPVLAMPMWEGSGNTVYDYSGNNLFGSFVLATSYPTWEAGGIYFSTDNHYISIPDNSLMEPDQFTLVAGCHALAGANYNPVAIKTTSSGFGDGYGIYLEYNARFYVNHYSTYASIDYILNDDCQLIGTFDGTNVRIYQNGIAGSPTTATVDKQGGDFRIGAYASNDWTGWIYYVYLFDVALTPTQVQTLNNNPYGLFEPIPKAKFWYGASGGTDNIKSVSGITWANVKSIGPTAKADIKKVGDLDTTS